MFQKSSTIYEKDSLKKSEYSYLKSVFPNLKVTKVYSPGDSFGEIALITKSTRMATIMCKTECEMITLSREGFNRMIGVFNNGELTK